ncbi:MAG TPA: nickel-dependent lactate racemase [Alphaproteobacteria bacterium]
MQVELRYGKGGLDITLDPAWRARLVRKPSMPAITDPPSAVRRALAHPVAAPALVEAAAGARSACILICDITRPVPNGTVLPVLVRALIGAGVPAEAITVLIATGLHRPNEGAELRELVGDDWVLETVRVENHDARDDAAHVHVGTTTRGNVVRLDRRFVDAELKIVTGLVEPHFMAGYSGGRKVIAPGVAHRDTITTFHSARYMEDANAVNCVLDRNPLHGDQLEIVAMIGGAVAVNTVIDEGRRLSFVNYGEIVNSHLDAVAFARRFTEVPVAERFPTVVTSAAGFPLDKTYYQTIKSMVAPLDILEPGGTLIVASQMSEGMGSAEFCDAQRRLIRLGPERFLDSLIAKRHADIDEWQTEMQLKPMRIGKVQLYSTGLSGSDSALTGVEMIDSVEQAIRDSVARAGDSRVALVPEGPYVVPQYRPEAESRRSAA